MSAERKSKKNDKNDKNNKMPLKRVISNNLFLLNIIVRAAPRTAVFMLAHSLIQSLVIFFEHTYQIVYIVNAIQYGKPFFEILGFLIIMSVIVTSNLILNSVMGSGAIPKAKEKIYRAVREKLYEKAKQTDIACYDNPEYYNEYVFALGNAVNRVDSVIEITGQTISNIVMLFVLGGYIVFAESRSIIFIVISFIMSYYFMSKSAKIGFDLNKALNPVLRKRDYVNRIFYLPDYVKEIKLSSVKERLLEDYAEAENQVYSELKGKTRKIAVFGFLESYLSGSFLFDFLFLLYLMHLAVVQNVIGFGTLFGLYRSSRNARGTITDFTHNIAGLREQSLYIDKMRAFLDYEQTVVSKPDPIPFNNTAGGKLELIGVSFTYPGAKEETLSDITLTINQGEKVAIVGYNGAGKTTLIKLLMRLYDPSVGEIHYDGEDIREYDVSEYRSLFSALFQDYQIYAATVAQNVIAGDGEPDAERLMNSIEAGGLAGRIEMMKDKLNTQLTKEFIEGEELSGGERQKLAISRSLYKNSPIIIFDEPSSALDPIAEFELNNAMLELGREKTLIFISHRLSTTRMADKIYMFEKGRLIESGSHDELIGIGGKYAEMYKLQAEKYR